MKPVDHPQKIYLLVVVRHRINSYSFYPTSLECHHEVLFCVQHVHLKRGRIKSFISHFTLGAAFLQNTNLGESEVTVEVR